MTTELSTQVRSGFELRNAIMPRLAMVTAAAGAVLFWLSLVEWPLPLTQSGLALALVVLSLGLRRLSVRYPLGTRHLFIWGLLALLLASMWLFGHPWLPLLGITIVISATFLLAGGGIAAAVIIGGASALLVFEGYRYYELPLVLSMLALTATLTAAGVQMLFDAVEWAGDAWRRANRAWAEAGARQHELNRTLKSLELADLMQRRTQYDLAVARKHADEARQMKEMFAANISHELRTPLNLIVGFTDLMYKTPEVYGDLVWPPTLRRDVYQVYSASRHLRDMINDILDLSHFEMTGFTLHREPTPLTPFLEDTMAIVSDMFHAHPVHLTSDLEPDLPSVTIDRTRIRQVLLNLFSNARRHTAEGNVSIAAWSGDGKVQIRVTDTGPGIAPDRLPFIFDEFYQVDSSLRRSREGAGLGLTICKRFVEAHGGQIWATSRVGEGTTFTFTLPLDAHLPAQMARSEETALPKQAQPCILMFDSDDATIDLVARHLEGYDLSGVAEWERLAEVAAAERPRAIIYNRAFADAVAAPHPSSLSVPVIECSLPSRTRTASYLGVAACLAKPVDAPLLLSELRRLGSIEDILIIDDDRGFVQLIARTLQAHAAGYRTRRAYGGEEGIEEMRRQRPDAVLLDLIMADFDGYQVLAEMRRDPDLANVPVIVLTATAVGNDAEAKQDGPVSVYRSQGLRVTETLRCIAALVDILQPAYDDREILEEAPRTSFLRSLTPESVRFDK